MFTDPSLHPRKFQPAAAVAVIGCALPARKVPPPVTVPPLAGSANTVSTAVGAKSAVKIAPLLPTTTVRGLAVDPSLQPMNAQPLDAVAVSTSLLPTTKSPLPVTEPPAFVLSLTVMVASGTKLAV